MGFWSDIPDPLGGSPGLPLAAGAMLFGIFGSLLGSFTNVVILRMAEGRSVVFPPSACPHCHHRLSALDLVPIFGWVMLRGRCRYCQAPISIQYPLVELAAALILASSFWFWGASRQLVPTAAWAIIWLIQTMLLIREEVAAPGPFLWPLLAFAVLTWVAGGPWLAVWALAPVLGTIAGWLATRGPSPGRFFPWFGVGTAAALAIPAWGWAGPLVLLGLAGIFPHGPTSLARKALKGALLLHLAAGLALAIRFGLWS
ncbi:MAG: Leader peptidase (Prepilin peptidase) [Candidatus Ozemobacter sibiricus]|jgi:leader peptidase (prepilin peptidase)/N-methyltransferase|uniref:Leader peptidase (Prepilin peptidase) n=1 Tax=Candidatus Ozemobacter sibiricus TaxID=2268124 RepID=A0A367ZQ55_9BACT|nr:MAG: Leader peptidase (Prepilin peptidase) [Candidatus Ozemobacter sibiricus]